jgi:hypothetical protein
MGTILGYLGFFFSRLNQSILSDISWMFSFFIHIFRETELYTKKVQGSSLVKNLKVFFFGHSSCFQAFMSMTL